MFLKHKKTWLLETFTNDLLSINDIHKFCLNNTKKLKKTKIKHNKVEKNMHRKELENKIKFIKAGLFENKLK